MGTMYKEIVVRRRTPVVIGLFLLVVIMITLSNMLEQVQVANFRIGFVTNPMLSVVTFVFIVFEIMKCKVSYRYSIIADQLIIHRLKEKEQSVVENIKLKNIVYVGKAKDYKENLPVVNSKRYTCEINLNSYCCVYKDGNKYKKFYFEPSSKLVEKLNICSVK